MKRLLPALISGLLLAFQAQAENQPEGAAQPLDQRIRLLERRVNALSDLVLRLDELQSEVRQLRGEVETQGHALDDMQRRQRELYLDIDQRLSQGAVPVPPPATEESTTAGGKPPAETPRPAQETTAEVDPDAPAQRLAPVIPPSSASPEEEEAYQRAFELLTQRRYDEARSAFQKFLGTYPAGAYADNAQYWLGEASYVTREFDAALTEFNKVLQLYPGSPKVAGAMLKIGYIQYDRQEHAQARETLDNLIKRFPESSAARLAQEFIRRKGL